MILVAGLLAFTSVWGQNTTSGWEDESGKIPVKAYFESGKLHFASKNENFHLWFDNRIYLDAAVYSPTSNVDDLTSKTNKDLEDDDNQFRFSNGVSIRRARFGVKATLYKKWFAELDLDFAYNEVEIKDMYLGYKFNNHFFEIGKDAAELLNYLKENGCDEVAVDTYVESHDGHPSKDDVIEFLEMLSSKIAEGKVSSTKKGVFLYRHDLISSEKVRKCASSLKILFDSRVMMAIVGIFIILDFIHFTEFYTETIHVDLSIYTVIGLFLFFIFSSLIHELGHASACHYFQIPHGNIGFGLYLNIPVFYTDVSQAWKLPRRERFLINIGGVYFQMVLLIPFLIAYFFFHYPFFKYIIVVMNMNFVITLNPFFKFDGYWILSDVLGVANLRKKGTEWVGYVLSKIKNKKVEHRPYLLRYPGEQNLD
mgnify:FL=1